MSYDEIKPIKSGTHLSNSLEYITKDIKTANKKYVDSYGCSSDFKLAEAAFEITRLNAVINKGDNLAWAITQSFSPEDDICPELALKIGKELMKEFYPNYQYVIATHIDREHIHNHIIMCSVNFVDYHKLTSNKYTLAKLRKVSNEISLKYGLSVITPSEKNDKVRLQNYIDNVINNSETFTDFIFGMQKLGYNIKKAKDLAFKDKSMKRYIRCTSISMDYSEKMIRERIKTKNPPSLLKRTIYDDKTIKMSKRKVLMNEINISISKTNTFDEFIENMKRKGFEVKTGKHLAFKGLKQERFFRCKSLGFEYTEDVIRFRLANKDFCKILDKTNIGTIIDRSKKYGALDNWAAGENAKIEIQTNEWVRQTFFNGKDISNVSLLYSKFIMEYDKRKNEINNLENMSNKLYNEIKELEKSIQAINNYWMLKPIIDKYNKVNYNNLTFDEQNSYKPNLAKWKKITDKMNINKEKYHTLKITDLKAKIKNLQQKQEELNNSYIKNKLSFEVFDKIKYNYESKDGYNLSRNDIISTTEQALIKLNQ